MTHYLASACANRITDGLRAVVTARVYSPNGDVDRVKRQLEGMLERFAQREGCMVMPDTVVVREVRS